MKLEKKLNLKDTLEILDAMFFPLGLFRLRKRINRETGGISLEKRDSYFLISCAEMAKAVPYIAVIKNAVEEASKYLR